MTHRKNSVGLGAATSPCPRLPPPQTVSMSLSREEWLYGFEDLTPLVGAVPLKDRYTRFFSSVLWLFDFLLLRKPVHRRLVECYQPSQPPSECSRPSLPTGPPYRYSTGIVRR